MSRLRVNDDLFKAYKSILKSVKSSVAGYLDDYEELSFAKRLEVEHQLQIAKDIENTIVDNYKDVSKSVSKFSAESANHGYNGVWYALEGKESLTLGLPTLSKDYIDTLVNAKVDGKRFSQRLYKHRADLAKNTTQALMNGVAHGKGYAAIAAEIDELTEADYKRALRIARTEGGRTQSIATQKGYEASAEKGIDLQKQWMATLDRKTRKSHQHLDGQTVGIDEQFESHGKHADGPRTFGDPGLDINCRCTTVPVVDGIAPDLRRDNMSKEDVPFQTYDEWAVSKSFKKQLDKPKAAITDWESILGKTNMREMVGEDNYKNFMANLATQKDKRLTEMLKQFGDQVSFSELTKGGSYAAGRSVVLNIEAFTKGLDKPQFEVVYHEIGHALDHIAGEKLRTLGNHTMSVTKTMKDKFRGKTIIRELEVPLRQATQSPDFNLSELIKRDLWRYTNGDLPMIDDLGKKPRKKTEANVWWDKVFEVRRTSDDNFYKLIERLNKDYEDNPDVLHGLSDIMEGTQLSTFLSDFPLGAGHGHKYWKTDGNLETEFMAHMFEGYSTTPESLAILQKVFPEAIKAWESMIDEILKAGG